MRFRRKYKKKNNFKNLIIIFLVISFSFLTIGYSAFQSNMEVVDTSVMVRLQKDIRVTNVSVSNTSLESISNWEDYNIKSISSNIELPYEDSEITYIVEITNIGNVEMGLFDIIGLPSNLKYTISEDNYKLKDSICDDLDSNKCKLGVEKNLYITISYDENGYDSNNTKYDINLNFDFKRIFTITYTGFNNISNLPKKVIEGDTKTIEFDNLSSIPVDVLVDGASYNYLSPNLTLSDVEEDVLIYKKYQITYELYDGIQAEDQITSISSSESIPLLEPTKEGYIFKGWYNNSDFEGEPIENLSNVHDDITLYAFWEEYDYYVKIATFDGTVESVRDTDIMLYSEENVNRNFQIKFTIENFDELYNIPSNIPLNAGQTLLSAMVETAKPYSGFAYRLAAVGDPAISKFGLKINDSHVSSYSGYYDLSENTQVEIVREDGKIYTKINSNIYTMVLDYRGSIDTFDVPLTIGGNINGNGDYDRYFKGKLTNISVEFYEGSLINKKLTYKETKTPKSYMLDGTILFDGTNYIDTGINLFSQENINKNFDITFTVEQVGANSSQATLVNLKDESQNNVWPGASYRYRNTKAIELTARWPGETNVSIDESASIPKTIRISRKNNVLYYSVNNGAEKKLISVPPSSLTKSFKSNLTFGSSINSSGNPFRFFNGIISNINVRLHDE